MTQNKKPPVLEVVNSAKKPTSKKPTGSTGGSGGAGSSKAKYFGDYSTLAGSFHQIKTVRAGPDGGGTVEFPLCNFVCHIEEEIITDDGLNDASFVRIQGRRNDGVLLPLVDVPSKNFYSSQVNWVNEHWGTLPFIYPGPSKRDNLRAAIDLYSKLNGDVSRRKVYKFTGWKRIDEHWHYLTGSGAITAVDTLLNRKPYFIKTLKNSPGFA